MEEQLKKYPARVPHACMDIPDDVWYKYSNKEQAEYCLYCKVMCPAGTPILIQYQKNKLAEGKHNGKL